MKAASGQYTEAVGARDSGLGARGSKGKLMAESFRTERDPLGEVQVPSSAYYGAQTQRAVENFPISGLRASDDLITATILVKKAAAEANARTSRTG